MPESFNRFFKTLKDWLMVTTSVLFPIVWGMFHLSLEGGSYLMRLVILPGLGTSQGKSESRDVFSRSEKWLGPSLTVDYSSWKSREDEVLGFTSFVQELVAWASQGSVQFGREIEQSTHWPTSISWSSLSVDQQSRAVRLSAILKATFGTHGRIAIMIQSFQEGIDIVPGVTLGDPYSSSNLYLGNGFELLRQLSQEFSLRSRTEGLSLRVQLLNKVFQGQDSSDLIRQIELACAKCTRMISRCWVTVLD